MPCPSILDIQYLSQVAGVVTHHLFTHGYSIYEQLTDHDDRIRGLESSSEEQQSRLWPLGRGKRWEKHGGDSWVGSEIRRNP